MAALESLVVGLARASYYISLLGLKIPTALLIRASRARYVLAFLVLVWFPFLGYCHFALLPAVLDMSPTSAIVVWHLVTAMWLTIPLVVVGGVVLSFINASGPRLSFFAALLVMMACHCFAIPKLAGTKTGGVLLHVMFAFFEGMPAVGWVWCLFHVVRLQEHARRSQETAKTPFGATGGEDGRVLIVGNAPTVVEGPPLGSLIDGFQHVVRFNGYVVSKPEWTGTKVDFHFCNGRSFQQSGGPVGVCPLFNASLTHAVYLFMPHMEEAVDILARLTSSSASSWFVDEEPIQQLRRSLGCRAWQIPTSGAIAINEFLACQPEVALHGFNFFQGKRIHYFEESPVQLITSWLERFVTHDPRLEKKWVDKLISQGRAKVLAKLASCPSPMSEVVESVCASLGKKDPDEEEDDLRKRRPGLVHTLLKDGLPSQFSL